MAEGQLVAWDGSPLVGAAKQSAAMKKATALWNKTFREATVGYRHVTADDAVLGFLKRQGYVGLGKAQNILNVMKAKNMIHICYR